MTFLRFLVSECCRLLAELLTVGAASFTAALRQSFP
jgi:hypothetical protein